MKLFLKPRRDEISKPFQGPELLISARRHQQEMNLAFMAVKRQKMGDERDRELEELKETVRKLSGMVQANNTTVKHSTQPAATNVPNAPPPPPLPTRSQNKRLNDGMNES